MIHYKINCENKSAHEKTGICTECAFFNHGDFIRRGKPVDEVHQIVRDALNSGKKWRIQKRPNRECGHPGIRNTRGECVFCITQERITKPVWRSNPTPSTRPDTLQHALEHTRKQIAALQEYEATLQTYITFGVSEAPQPPQFESPRQIAVREGNKWYIPSEPCTRCHTLSERYVANGRCRGCE